MSKVRIILVSLIVLLIFLPAGVAWAGSSTNYTIAWWVQSSGGAPATSGSGNITLTGSLGQTAIGNSTSTGGNYTLGAGFWSVSEPQMEPPSQAERVYLPLVLR